MQDDMLFDWQPICIDTITACFAFRNKAHTVKQINKHKLNRLDIRTFFYDISSSIGEELWARCCVLFNYIDNDYSSRECIHVSMQQIYVHRIGINNKEIIHTNRDTQTRMLQI